MTRLTPLVVRVARAERSWADVPFSVSVLNAADIGRGRATLGLDEALSEIPGVFVSNRYNPSLDQRISIRGFGARSAFGVRGVKILIDGIPQTLPDGQGQLSNLDLSSVGSIEVLRGGASSLYGNATGGVIDIRTATPDPGRSVSNGRLVVGQFGTLKLAHDVSHPVGRGAVAVNASFTRADGYREHSASTAWQAATRFRYPVGESGALLVSAHLSDQPVLDNPGSLNATELAADPSQSSPANLSADAGKAVMQGQLGVGYTRALASGGRLEIVGYGLFRDLDNPLSFAYIQVDRTAAGLRSVITLPVGLGSGASFSAGIDLQRQRDDRLNRSPDRSSVTLDQLETVLEFGPFVSFTVRPASTVVVTAGGRYDRLSFNATDRMLSNGNDSGSRTMSAISGTVGGVFQALDAAQPFVNVGTAFESPTTTELANRPTGPGGFNPSLDPQRAVSFEGGVRGVIDDVMAYSLSAFTVSVNDALVPFEVPTDPGRRFFRNSGTVDHAGIEVDLRIEPRSPVSGRVAYTYARYRFDEFQSVDGVFDGNDVPGIPSHQLHASARFGPFDGFWFAVDQTVRSSMQANDANSVEIDGYAVTGLRAGLDRPSGGWLLSPFVGVLNTLNKTYVGSVVVNAGFGRYYEPAPGRNVYVGMAIRGG